MPSELDALHGKASAGDKKALFELGLKYYKGEGVTKDLRAAARYFNNAAMKGYGPAQCQMAYMSAQGEGTPKNSELVKHWTNLATQAADQCLNHLSKAENDGDDQYFLGIYYQIIKKDEETAAKWFQRALANPDVAVNKNHLLLIDEKFKLATSYTRIVDELSNTTNPKDAHATLSTTHYPYHKNRDEKGSRFHAFKVNLDDMRENEELTDEQYFALNDRYPNLKGDHLKSAILSDFKARLEKADNSQKLNKEIVAIKSSPEYKIISKGQGVITRLFDHKTSSVVALEGMIKERKAHFGEIDKPEGSNEDPSSQPIR